MKYYHFNTISKLTLALLDAFNDISVQREDEQGLVINEFNVPIVFGQRDKAFVLSEQDSEALLSGNVNILPRMALTFESVSPAPQRQTNKYNKINKTLNGETISYQYNAVPMDYSYTLHIATRTMTDASVITEQIIPYFNPNYTLFVNELELQDEPTTIPVLLDGVDYTLPEEYETDEIRLIECQVSLTVKGNMYPPIKDAGLIKKVKIYNGMNDLRTSKYEFDINNDLSHKDYLKTDFFDSMGNNPPVIESVQGILTMNKGEERTYTVLFNDVDSDEFIYVWSIVQGSGIVSTNKQTVLYKSDNTLTINDTVTIRVIVIDSTGKQSLPYDFNVEVTV